MTETNTSAPIALVKKMIRMVGVVFLIAGLYCFYNADMIASFLFSDDVMIAKIFSAVIVFIGCMDLFVLPLLIKEKDNK